MARSLNKAKKTKKEGRNSMAENIVFQILRSHLMEGELTPGTPIAIRVDQTLGHDLTGIMAGQTFLAVGADRVQTEASVFYCDHNTLCVSGENADDHLFLKTAAATAVTGHITDPRDLMDVSVLAKIQEPEAYIIDDSSLIAPEETADRHAVEVIKGPNISELPMRGPVRETIDAGIVLKLGDNITTDDIIPAGASILKYISNIPEFAKYTFCYTDPDFVDRARRMGHSVIVGGENYGQGSSREYAAMLPMCLGVEAVIAKSYARIHKENLFNYGILPLIFEDPADYEKLQQGDRLVLENVPEGIRAGRLTVTVPERGLTLTAVLEASDYDKNLLLEGGALNHLAKLQKR